MMRLTNTVLKFLGWYCDPSKAMPVPTYKPTQAVAIEIPKNVQFDQNGRPFATTTTANGITSEVVTIGRDGSRTGGDDWVLSLPPEKNKPALKPEKYFRLKTMWAKEVSAKDAAQILKGEKGFGIRTLDYYWAAFAKSQRHDHEKEHHSPTE